MDVPFQGESVGKAAIPDYVTKKILAMQDSRQHLETVRWHPEALAEEDNMRCKTGDVIPSTWISFKSSCANLQIERLCLYGLNILMVL